MLNAQFKAQVALETLSQLRTITEIAEEYEISPNIISKWKSDWQKRAKDVFLDKRKKESINQEKKVEKLYQQIGKQKVKIDWLKKNLDLSPRDKIKLIEPNNSQLSLAR